MKATAPFASRIIHVVSGGRTEFEFRGYKREF